MARFDFGLLTVEALDFQKKSQFFNELVLCFTRLQEMHEFSDTAFVKVGLDKLVQNYTKLNITTRIISGQSEQFNAFAEPPTIDPNGPFSDVFKQLNASQAPQRWQLSEQELLKISAELQGSINTKTGQVSGVFSKIPVRVFVGDRLPTILTPEQIAGIYLHEIGHHYTAFTSLTNCVTTNMAIAYASDALASASTKEQRLKIVHVYQNASGKTVSDVDGLINSTTSKDGFQAVLIRDVSSAPLRSAVGSSTYDLRSSEFAADYYAGMHGAGRPLMEAIDLIQQYVGLNTRETLVDWMAAQVMNGANTLINAFLTPLFGGVISAPLSIFITLSNPYREHRLYDRPAERVKRMRNNLVQALKTWQLDKRDRAALLNDIAFIDKLSVDMADRRSVFDLIWLSLSPMRRRQYRLTKFQQELETVINNNLFVTASKLTQLANQGA